MSRRNWLQFALGGALIVFLAVFGWESWLSYRIYHSQHAYERHNTTQYNYENGEQFVKDCVGSVEPPSFAAGGLGCLVKGMVAKAEAKRSYYDLKAQQEMAEWAFGVLMVSIAGFISTVVGVVLVGLNLHEARKTTDAVTLGVKAELEPIFVIRITSQKISVRDGRMSPAPNQCCVVNEGRSAGIVRALYRDWRIFSDDAAFPGPIVVDDIKTPKRKEVTIPVGAGRESGTIRTSFPEAHPINPGDILMFYGYVESENLEGRGFATDFACST